MVRCSASRCLVCHADGFSISWSGGKHFTLCFGYDLGGHIFDSREPERGLHSQITGRLGAPRKGASRSRLPSFSLYTSRSRRPSRRTLTIAQQFTAG